MKSKHYILYIIVAIVILPVILHSAYADNDNIAMKGNEVAGLSESTYNDGNLIIALGKTYPGLCDDITGEPLGKHPVASEWIHIFGDGKVFSKRYFREEWVDEYFPDEFELDDTWECNREYLPVYVRRHTEYHISSDQIKGLLEILGSKEEEMLPGPVIMNHFYHCWLRIIYNDQEGLLLEPLNIGIEDQENVLIIGSMLKNIREIESEVVFDKVNSSYFTLDLNAKKKEFGWYVRSILEPERFMGVDSAQAAFGYSE